MKTPFPLKRIVLFALTGGVISVLFALAMISVTGGHVVAPLDDSYICFQYARNLSRGRFFEYSEQAGFSSGSTSLVYPLLLAPFFWAGFSGVKILAVSFALGAACFILSAVLLFLTGRALFEERVGMAAAFLFLINGNLAWNYLSGMETGLFATLLLAAAYYLARWTIEKRGKRLIIGLLWFSLASLARPEGFALLLVCVIFIIVKGWRFYSSRILLSLIALLPFTCYLIFVKMETGDFSTSGVLEKSVLSAPYYTPWEKMGKLVDNFLLIFGAYYQNLANTFFYDGAMFPLSPIGALYPYSLFPPAAFLLALAGVILGIARERDKNHFTPVFLVALLFLLGILCVINAEVVASHYFRYLIPFQPLFLLFVSLGLFEFSRLFDHNGDRLFRVSSIILVLFMIPSLFYWAYIYGENCNDLFEQHRRTSWWIKDATPPDSVIGVTDAGVIAYFSERRTYDFVGLTTPRQSRHWRQGRGSTFERLERLHPDALPDYIVSFPFVWGDVNFLGKPVHGAPLLKNLTTMSNDFVVFEQDWSLLHSGDLPAIPPPGMELADALDVADLADETAHGYVWKEAAERPAGWAFPNTRNFFHKAIFQDKPVADGGRDLSFSEAFTVNLSPGKPFRLIARTESLETSAAQVFINDAPAGILEAIGENRGWEEPGILIPAELLQERANRIEIRYLREKSRSGSFHSYHYWFYQ
ncbi:glycosyltransferase family 39 protein [Candidatus Sumerlaeota bacterium]|nr:glycosyltransferase family 39 protein [Candidatus Sumerlaeota bacterium]